VTVTIVAHDVGGVGGMERQLEELITGLLARGVQVEVVSRTLQLSPHPELRWRRVRGPARPFVVAYPWFALVASLMLLRRRGEVLHVTGAIVFNRADVCTVHYVHNGARRTSLRMRRSARRYRLNAWLARALSRRVERRLYRRESKTHTLVAVLADAALDLIRAYPERAASVRVIHNGVDLQRFRADPDARRQVRAELRVDDDAKLAVFVGSEWLGKGLAIAVEALSSAPGWQLCVVGSGDAARLSALVAELGVEGPVHVLGETSAPERYYAAGDAFVLPSEYETFSLAVLEAAATGLPVVATDVGVVGSLVEAGGGILVDRTPAAFASALRELAENPGRATILGDCAREYAARFGWDAVVDAYLALYQQLRPVPSPEARELRTAA
jgi:glycosyltransferase involved in cell wall biosynthesis